MFREGQKRPSLSMVAEKRDPGICFEKTALFLLMLSGDEKECAQDESNNNNDVEMIEGSVIMHNSKRDDGKSGVILMTTNFKRIVVGYDNHKGVGERPAGAGKRKVGVAGRRTDEVIQTFQKK